MVIAWCIDYNKRKEPTVRPAHGTYAVVWGMLAN